MTNEELSFEVNRLSAETLVLQTLLFNLLFHIQRKSDDPIKLAFNDAADLIEQMTVAAGKTVSPEHLAKALGIIEQTRKWVIPAQKPEAERKRP